jgi:hypothetical protein
MCGTSRTDGRAVGAASTVAMLTVVAILLWQEVRALDVPGARYGVGVSGTFSAFPAK